MARNIKIIDSQGISNSFKDAVSLDHRYMHVQAQAEVLAFNV